MRQGALKPGAWLVCAMLAFSSRDSRAQAVRLTPTRAKPLVTVGDTITLSASPTAVRFALVPAGSAPGSTAVVITTSYSGVSLLSSFSLYGFFSSATAALTGGTPVSSIPSSCVLGLAPTGSVPSYTAFTQSDALGAPGAGLQLYQANSILGLSGSRTDSLSLEINLLSIPQLPAASYSGVLTLEVQAF